MLKSFAASACALALMATSASALVVTNNSDKEHTIGVDMGAEERVETIAPGKSVDLSEDCKDACGLTGPWAYSYLGKTGEKLSFDGKTNALKAIE